MGGRGSEEEIVLCSILELVRTHFAATNFPDLVEDPRFPIYFKWKSEQVFLWRHSIQEFAKRILKE